MQPHELPALADVVLRLADVCEQLAIPYAIGGAVATSFWGVPRTTQDADCLVAVPAIAYQRLADALNANGFEIEQPSGPEPVTVGALAPRYLTTVPLDPFIDKPFIYERRGDGYLLASVGENGVYDGGDAKDGWIVGGEWQATGQDVDRDKSDLVVRMPVPPRPAAP